MLPLSFIEYEIDTRSEDLFTRLRWATEQVEPSWLDYMNWTLSPATDKDWLGQIDEENMDFFLEQPAHLFRRRLNVVVAGEIEERTGSSYVKIRIGLDNLSFIMILLIYFLSSAIIYDSLTIEGFNFSIELILWLIAYPVLSTVLVRWRVIKAEKKLEKVCF